MHRGWWERHCIGVDLGCFTGNCIWVCLGCSCIARNERERERAIANGSARQQCLHQQCSKCNCRLQDPTLCLTTKAPPPPHGEEGGRSGGACCYAIVCSPNSTLPISNFCSTPHFFPERTKQKRHRNHGNCKVSCVVPLCVSVHCFLLTVRVFGLFAERF